MGFKAKARKNKPQNADKGAEKKKSRLEKCLVQSNLVIALLTRNSVDAHCRLMMLQRCGDQGTLYQQKAVFEYANPVIVRGRKKTRTMICIDFTFTFTFVS